MKNTRIYSYARRLAFGRSPVTGLLTLAVALCAASVVRAQQPATADPPAAATAEASDDSKEREQKKEPEKTRELTLADRRFVMQIPESWQSGRPAVSMIEHEIKVPRAEGDAADGRLTMMLAGGSVDANVQRWAGQFKGAPEPKTEVVKVGDMEVRVVELAGVFLERAGGPVTPATERPEYRLLGAIVPTGGQNHYFIKLTGPAKTIAANRESFLKAIESLKSTR